ncbi:hypothetical protein CKM354_000222400 [Cercospora kikuchii]|uniref:Uncharacterized protein n=1 Tax=Cercospora kikuchii TaxID=84275 RepID=A0A9P3F9F2_9PEZI|nr:uncharacterized protein CKM354_000222400 [Cercospora kikuchii]GIZ38823.1 hypothetical protein CKM354_000222400 [Cercospora kikuchii]
MTSQEEDKREFASSMLAETPKAKKVRPARRETMDENVVIYDHTEYYSAGLRRGSTVPKHTLITREVSPRLPSRFLNVVDDPTDEDYTPSSKKLPPSRRILAAGISDNATLNPNEDSPVPALVRENSNRSIGRGVPALRTSHNLRPKPHWLSRRNDNSDPDGSVYDTGLCKDDCADPATEEMLHCDGDVCYAGGGLFHLHCVYFTTAPPLAAADLSSDEDMAQKKRDGKGKGSRLGDGLAWEMKK